VSRVRFATLTDAQVARYVAQRRAARQGRRLRDPGRGGRFIEHISGSYSGIMGLPMFETAQLLRSAGFTT
jgi:septum formation protein